MEVKVLSIDLAKEIFYVYGVDNDGRIVVDKKCSRAILAETVHKLRPQTIFMEACGTSNFWARKFSKMGINIKLISPQHVKPFVGRQKNDRNDARAIFEAGCRPDAKFVPIKELWQQDLQSLHRVRQRIVSARVQIGNEILGLLAEYGVFVGRGKNQIIKTVPLHLENAENELTVASRRLIANLVEDFKKHLEIEGQYTEEILSLAEASSDCQKVQTIEGVGPITATAFVSAIGSGMQFKNGRSVSAWLGVVPLQSSSGGKTKLLGITKTGNIYLRTLVIQGARTVLMSYQKKGFPGDKGLWLKSMIERKGFNKTAVALANKNTRHMWAVLVA